MEQDQRASDELAIRNLIASLAHMRVIVTWPPPKPLHWLVNPCGSPSAFMTPISRVFCTVTVIKVLMMPKAATMMMNVRMKNITDFST